MRQVVLDTETTGLEVEQHHRIIEIGCVEIFNRRLTGRSFHQYLNPEREIDEGAVQVHGLTRERLASEPTFSHAHPALLEFIRDAELIIHNAPFDVAFLDAELKRIEVAHRVADLCRVLDTLALARQMHPGQRNSLDALCKRYSVDNSHREYHGALLDARILAEVYLAMTGGQGSLTLSAESDTARSGIHQAAPLRSLTDIRVVVINANEDETAAHEHILALLDKTSSGQTVAKIVKLLVTGAAGFIGFHTARLLLERGDEVVGLDNLNAYYDPALKQARLDILQGYERFRFVKADLADRPIMESLFHAEKFQRVVHLGAQAGVRHSIENPHAYVQSNVVGFLQVIEGCRHNGVEHLVYASTSSVYGANTQMPFSEKHGVDHPITLYAATKRSNELMAHSYSSLFGLPTTGLRFFTVYGPWGRPDMALFLFTKNILAGLPIEVFNDGHHQRDFTYVDDIVKGVVAAVDHVAAPDPNWDSDHPNPSTSNVPFRIYNIGNHTPVSLLRYIEVLEQCLGRKAQKNLLPMQIGDVPDTWADVEALAREVGYRPSTELEQGVKQFVEWYLSYYHRDLELKPT